MFTLSVKTLSTIATLLVIAAYTTVQSAPRLATCEFVRGKKLIEKKLCTIDWFNGGMFQIKTQGGTISIITRSYNNSAIRQGAERRSGIMYSIEAGEYDIKFRASDQTIRVIYSR